MIYFLTFGNAALLLLARGCYAETTLAGMLAPREAGYANFYEVICIRINTNYYEPLPRYKPRLTNHLSTPVMIHVFD